MPQDNIPKTVGGSDLAEISTNLANSAWLALKAPGGTKEKLL